MKLLCYCPTFGAAVGGETFGVIDTVKGCFDFITATADSPNNYSNLNPNNINLSLTKPPRQTALDVIWAEQ